MFGAPATAQTNASQSGTGGSLGFSFGGGAGQTKPTGFALPTPAASTPASSAQSTGFTLGTPASKPTGITFGNPASASVAATTGTTLSGLLKSTTATSAPSGGFTLGGGLGSSASTGSTLGGTAGAGGLGSSAGFSFGGGATSSSLSGTTTASTGFTLGGSATSGGLTLGGGTTGIGFGGGLGGATTKPGLTLGAPAASSSLTLGQPASSGTGIFSSTTVATSSNQQTSKGLGGTDPKTSAPGVSGSSGGSKVGDSKVVKESQVPPEIVTTVENFEKYVREQKNVRENNARMLSKQPYKVQEEIASLQQMVSSVKIGLQQNAVCIDKLKHESSQELKNAEVAQRTKDTPPGLQYENTAPAEYFSRLVDEFETQMMVYRQQIEDLESHLTSLSQSAVLTPQELLLLLRKIYENFGALAAQLHSVHEAVKVQKEHFLNYRRVFLNDTTDIFERRKKIQDATGSSVVTTMAGPTPFTGVTSKVAKAMTNALSRPQQPTAPTGGASFGVMGSSGVASGSGLFGASASNTSFGLGSSAFKPAVSTGFGLGSGLGFGGSASAPKTAPIAPIGGGSLFGGQNITTGGFGANNTSFGNTSGFAQPGFALGKPPAGNKRTKKT